MIVIIFSVPVREVIIMDGHGQRLRDVVGPYDEGSYVSFICEAEGGKISSILFMILFLVE